MIFADRAKAKKYFEDARIRTRDAESPTLVGGLFEAHRPEIDFVRNLLAKSTAFLSKSFYHAYSRSF